MKLHLEKIDREMKRLGWSKYKLGEMMGVRPQWVYQVLDPDYQGITLKTIEKIAKALDCDPKDLII